MPRMRIGIHASNSRSGGGQFQFLVTVLDALHRDRRGDEFFAFYFHDHENLSGKYAGDGWHWIALPPADGSILGPKAGPMVLSWMEKLLRPFELRLSRIPPRRQASRAAQQSGALRSFLAPLNLDLMLFPQWTDQCWQWGLPYLFFVHDLQHRLQPEFPEVAAWGQWQWREDFFSSATRGARLVVVDSEEGKRNAADAYGLDPAKLKVLPYAIPPTMTSGNISAHAKPPPGLPARYFIYPAQFWPHKNHYRVVEAVGLLKKKHGLEVHAVFAGGDPEMWGALENCRGLADTLGISAQIHLLGYVPDETLAALYRSAVGLVMPTYFGPTNIPYLEAFHFECPVIASDLPGIREQVGDAALLVDPRNSAAIAEAMRRLWSDDALRLRLKADGKRRLQALESRNFASALRAVLAEAIR